MFFKNSHLFIIYEFFVTIKKAIEFLLILWYIILESISDQETTIMMISTKGRYALRILADLALLSEGEFASVKDIADNQGISLKYLEAITSILL